MQRHGAEGFKLKIGVFHKKRYNDNKVLLIRSPFLLFALEKKKKANYILREKMAFHKAGVCYLVKTMEKQHITV